MNRFVALLLFVTLVWGTTFPLLKELVATLSGAEISALRFLVAAMCMLPFAFRVPRHTWPDGTLLGVLALVAYVAQAWALEYISANRSAFLTSLNVLIVPLLGLLWGASVSMVVFGAAAVACIGVALMSWEGGANLLGDGLTLLCALSYAVYLIVLSQRSRRHDPLALAAAQVVVMALLGALWLGGAALVDTGPALFERVLPHMGTLLYLGAIATAAMLYLQTLGQRHVAATQAAVVFAMEPVFAALSSWIWIGETLTPRAALGGALVVLAVILSEWKPPARSAAK